MPSDTLRSSSPKESQRKDTGGGTAAKGYAEHEVDGSDFNKYGNRIEYAKLAASTFK